MGGFQGIDQEIARLERELEQVEKTAVQQINTAALSVLQMFFDRTPVHTGETVRNYTVGVGGPNNNHTRPSGGPPGRTSQMPIGSEPNRSINEQAALAAAEASSNKTGELKDLVITNTIDAEKWDLIDNGSAPTKDASRNPGGVSKIVAQSARVRLKGMFK